MLLALCLMALTATPGMAQTPSVAGDILWLVDGSESEGIEDEVLAGVEEALAAERHRHLLGEQELYERVSQHSSPLSECALGIAPCEVSEAMAFDALGLGLMLRLTLDEGDEKIKINYEMVDRRGEVASRGDVESQDLRQAGFELVRQLFDAVGVVSFESSPSGATVEVDGEVIGQTPLSEQFGVGSYTYRMETPTHDGLEGEFEVRTGDVHRVVGELDERAGSLRIHDAPQDATLWIDDEERGMAREIIELEAGRHIIEVRADGYDTDRHTVEIEAAEVTDIHAQMRAMPALFRDVAASEMAAHRFQFDAGLEMAGQWTNFHAARGSFDDRSVVVDQWLHDGDGEGAADRLWLASTGIRLGMGWEGRRLGLGFLSLSLLNQSVDQAVRLSPRGGGQAVDATLEGVQTLQIRPMQVRMRFFYRNLAPFGQAGIGASLQWIDVVTQDRQTFRMRQVEPFIALEVGARYHFDPRWSVGLSLRTQSYLGSATAIQQSIGISVGAGLRELPGLEPRPPGEL